MRNNCKHLFPLDGGSCLYCGAENPNNLEAMVRAIVRDEVEKATKPKIEIKCRRCELVQCSEHGCHVIR